MTQRTAAALALLLGAVMLPGCVVVGRSDNSSGGSAFGLLFFLVPILVFAAMFRLMRRPKPERVRRAGSDIASQPSVTMLRAELSVLADDVLRLEPQVTLKPEARDDYEAALLRYRVAQAALDDSDAAVDLVRVQRVVDEASWSMARARAILEGRPPPAPPAPLRHAGPGGEPAVTVDGSNHPRYVESPAPFRSGWFAFGPGLFGGLLLGSMLDHSDWFGDDGGSGDDGAGGYGDPEAGDHFGDDFG